MDGALLCFSYQLRTDHIDAQIKSTHRQHAEQVLRRCILTRHGWHVPGLSRCTCAQTIQSGRKNTIKAYRRTYKPHNTSNSEHLWAVGSLVVHPSQYSKLESRYNAAQRLFDITHKATSKTTSVRSGVLSRKLILHSNRTVQKQYVPTQLRKLTC